MISLSQQRSDLGVQYLQKEQLPNTYLRWPQTSYGGLISENDGRINPISLLKALQAALLEIGVEKINKSVKREFRKPTFNG